MSTSQSDLQSGRQYVNFDEFIEYHLQRTRSQLKITDIATACVLCGLGGLTYLLLFVVADQWLLPGGWPVSARIAMLTAVVSAIMWLLARRVVYPLTRTVNSLYAARAIEQTDPKLKGTLLTAVDLQQAGLSPTDQEAVIRAIEKRAALGLQTIDVEQAVDRLPLLRLSYGLLAVVAASCLYVVLSPKDPFVSVRRALLPTADLSVATRTTISDVTPGNQTVPARSMLEVEADIRGRFAGPVHLVYTTADKSFVDQPVEMRRIDEGLPRFRGTITGPNGKGILQDLTWHIEAGDARSADYTLTIVQPPSATVKEIKYVHPPYMQLEPKTTTIGAIDGWEGSQVTLKATANMPVKSAVLLLFDSEEGFQRSDRGEQIAVSVVKGTELTASWTLALRADGTYARFYRLQVETASGAKDPDPTQFPIKIRPDQAPEVALLHPTSDLERPINIPLPLAIQASDADFGLRTVTLKSEKNGEGLADIRLFEDRLPAQAIRADYEWDLSRQGFKPGDVVQFWIEARDSKQPVANRRVTNKLNVRIVAPVSPDAARQQLAADKQAQQDQLAQADPPAADGENAGPMPADPPQPDENPVKPPEPDNGARPPVGDEGTPRNPDQESVEPRERPNPDTDTPERENNGEKPADAVPRDEKRPADDAEALERFIRKLEEEQQRRNPANQPPDRPGQNEPEAGTNGETDNPQPDNPADAPAGKAEPRRDAQPQPPGKSGNSGRGKSQPGDDRKPASEQPDRGNDGENQPSKRNDPAESSDTDAAGRGKKPTQSRERPGTDDATGSNVPMPSKTGERSNEPSPNKSGPQKAGGKPGESRDDDSSKPESGEGAPGRKSEPSPTRDGKPRDPDNTKRDNPAAKDGQGATPGNERPDGDKGAPGEKTPQAGPSRDGKRTDGDSPMTGDRDASAPTPGKPDSVSEKRDGTNSPEKGGDSKTPKTGNKAEDRTAGDRNAGDTPANQKAGTEKNDGQRNGDGKTEGAKPGTPNERNPNGAPTRDPAKSPENDDAKPSGDKPQPDAGGKANSKEKGTGQPQRNTKDPAAAKPGDRGDSKRGTPADDGKPEQQPNGQPPANSKSPDGGRPSDQMPTERGPDSSSEKPQSPNGSPSAPRSNPQQPGSQQQSPQERGGSNEPGGNGKGEDSKSGPSGSKPGSEQPGASPGKPGATDSDSPNDASSKPEGGKPGKRGDGAPGDAGKPSPNGGKDPQPSADNPGGRGEKSGSGNQPGDMPGASDMPGEKGSDNGSPAGRPGRQSGEPKESGSSGDPSGKGDKGESAGKGSSPSGKGAGQKPGDSPADGQPSEGQTGGDSKSPGGKGEEAQSGKGGDQPGSAPNGEGGQQSSGGKGSDGKASGNKSSGESGGKGGKPANAGNGPRANPKSEGQTGESQGSDVDRRGKEGGVSADNPSGERPAATETLTADEQAEAARLDYARKATDLVLNRIRDQIERGEIDQKTLDELGWTKEDLARFAERLQQRKQAVANEDNSPEAVARRMQFEEELKQLRIGGDVRKRSNSEGPARRTSVGNRQAPVPPELRDQYDAYTRSLSKSRTSPGKSAPATPSKPAPSR